MSTICIQEHTSGTGGVAGGAGELGQTSQVAGKSAATGYGYPVISLVTGMPASVTVQLTDDIGGVQPALLSGVTTVKLRLQPTMSNMSGRKVNVACTFTSDGKVTANFTKENLKDAQGVWYAEFLCFNASNTLCRDFRAYVAIRKGMEDSTDGPHPLTVMDVRLALMDTDPTANQLLDDLEFSDLMILDCIMRAIDEWNETPPALATAYDATTFPYRAHLIKGVIGHLMQMVGYKYLRNQMRYSASGFSTDTNDKGNVYVQLAVSALGEWRAFIASKKTEQNMLECFGTIAMPEFG